MQKIGKTPFEFYRFRHYAINLPHIIIFNILTRQRIELDKTTSPVNLFEGYRNLAFFYSKTGQNKQVIQALDTCLYYYQQYQNDISEEKHQLAEVKCGVEKQKQQIQQRNLIFIISILTVLFIIVFISLARSFNRQKKIDQQRKEKAELLARQTMKEKEEISKKLIISITELDRKNLLIEKAKDMDKEQFDRVVQFEQKKSKLTTDYVKLFDETNSVFYKQLQAHAAPNDLSSNDLKYCAYILLRMNNKDIANVMNVEYNTVVSQKYRLKKKLHLSENDSLEEFIAQFS